MVADRAGPGRSRLRVIAPDLPGHGRTRAVPGRHHIIDTAADIAGTLRRRMVLDPVAGASLAGSVAAGPVVAHSWGAMAAASLPVAGVRPARIVLLDPPAIGLDVLGR